MIAPVEHFEEYILRVKYNDMYKVIYIPVHELSNIIFLNKGKQCKDHKYSQQIT